MARAQCVKLGILDCFAVTCNAKSQCFVRTQSDPEQELLRKSTQGETSYIPSGECFEACDVTRPPTCVDQKKSRDASST